MLLIAGSLKIKIYHRNVGPGQLITAKSSGGIGGRSQGHPEEALRRRTPGERVGFFQDGFMEALCAPYAAGEPQDVLLARSESQLCP
jgi:hypothetical protein